MDVLSSSSHTFTEGPFRVILILQQDREGGLTALTRSRHRPLVSISSIRNGGKQETMIHFMFSLEKSSMN